MIEAGMVPVEHTLDMPPMVEPSKLSTYIDQIIHKGFKPDDITFVSLLTACSHGGLVLKVNNILIQWKGTTEYNPERNTAPA
ncbi:pentatricopeptide repeat-containing protein [Senna tora]|uniref:Pentatricopeptide repeat-containing protein n=1 Tax=Senna tora TaxID=362788 RepID=A0A834TXI0_9FABA|nr:pentatricopeptide repeat-containing protein [Senna tora]